MDASDHRQLVTQLAEDLSWLEDHCRRQADLAQHAGQLRLAAALVRDVIGPFLNGQPPTPLHIAVVGGAGAGKSTIVNFLCGSVVAEANPQAGYTRHPTAHIATSSSFPWPAHSGFLGPLQRLSQPAPANLDEDVYQVKRVSVPSDAGTGFGALGDVVIWDCPDMTAWAATGYVSRLVEISALADVIVYVASDERYNDEVPTQFLNMLIRANKPVVVCLTKMREAQSQEIVQHFQSEVLGKLPKLASGKPPVPVLAIPFLTAEQLRDPAQNAGKYRIPLLNQLVVLLDPPEAARRRSVENAMRFLNSAGEGLLEVARQDLAALDSWRNLVQSGQMEFDGRYQREFLNGERFRRFDDTRDYLLNLLELPGAGRLLSSVLWAIRLPYRLLRNFMNKAVMRPESINLAEDNVLDEGRRAWLNQLRAESLRRADGHALWRHVVNGFNSGLEEAATERYKNDLHRFQVGSADEIDATCRALTSGLERNVSLLAFLRVAKLLLDAIAIGLAFWAGGLSYPTLIYIPLFASISHQLVEVIVWQFVEQKRISTRARREEMVKQYISGPLAEWLIQWPATGGSAYERLQMTLRRVPDAIRELTAGVNQLLSKASTKS